MRAVTGVSLPYHNLNLVRSAYERCQSNIQVGKGWSNTFEGACAQRWHRGRRALRVRVVAAARRIGREDVGGCGAVVGGESAALGAAT